MKAVLFFGLYFFLLNCGGPKETNTVIITPPKNEDRVIIEKDSSPPITTPSIPKGAITANFISETLPFFAVVEQVNKRKGTTTIGFENNSIPRITIPESVGALLHPLRLEGFDRDLLLAETTYKDPIFKKYYLYIFKDNTWKEVVTPFMLHVDNVSEGLIPIWINPNNPEELLRYYSVFDLDPESTTKYGWVLHQEQVPILER